jgi:hypothetical protein
MAAPLEAYTREEQRAVIRFLGSEGEKPADSHRRMKRQYGDACVSLQQVYERHRKFKRGGGVSVRTMRQKRRCIGGYAVSQTSFFSRGIQALVKRWHNCIECGGDYVEK